MPKSSKKRPVGFKMACPRPGRSAEFHRYSSQLGKFWARGRASLAKCALPRHERASGEMAEWLKAHAWKACVRETVPWVRIPLSPPLHCSPLYPIVRINSKNNDER